MILLLINLIFLFAFVSLLLFLTQGREFRNYQTIFDHYTRMGVLVTFTLFMINCIVLLGPSEKLPLLTTIALLLDIISPLWVPLFFYLINKRVDNTSLRCALKTLSILGTILILGTYSILFSSKIFGQKNTMKNIVIRLIIAASVYLLFLVWRTVYLALKYGAGEDGDEGFLSSVKKDGMLKDMSCFLPLIFLPLIFVSVYRTNSYFVILMCVLTVLAGIMTAWIAIRKNKTRLIDENVYQSKRLIFFLGLSAISALVYFWVGFIVTIIDQSPIEVLLYLC